MNYQVADFVIRLKNAALAKRRKVLIPNSRMNKSLGRILVKENFLKEIKEEVKEGKKALVAELRFEKRIPVFTDVLIVSKPSLRIYTRAKNISKIKKGGGLAILSTSKGTMTDVEAKKKGLGGEVLFKIW